MKRRLIFLLLASSTLFGQTFSAATRDPESDKIVVHLVYEKNPDFVEEQCYWHIYEAGQPKGKFSTIEGCHAIDYSLANGTHMIELVINGRQKQYQHLSIEQRHLLKSITVAPRVKIDDTVTASSN